MRGTIRVKVLLVCAVLGALLAAGGFVWLQSYIARMSEPQQPVKVVREKRYERLGSTPGCVSLTAREPEMGDPQSSGGLLVREIIRQSVLIAARDGLGVPTRDMALREPFPAPDDRLPDAIEIRTNAIAGKRVLIRLSQKHGQSERSWEKEVPVSDPEIDTFKLVAAMEGLSRGEFVQVLAGWNFQGPPNARAKEGLLPVGVEERLLKMSLFEQYAGLRQIHAAIRESGESPERLGGLVRAYANLGQLTRFHWNASHKVFKARALLYAERMMVLTGGSAAARWHRAYARALTGLQGGALKDMSGLTSQPASRPGDIDAPAWGKVLAAYCHYEPETLQAVCKTSPELAGLASYLAFKNIQTGAGVNLLIYAGQKAIEHNPECYEVIDALCGLQGVGLSHWSTSYGPASMDYVLSGHLLNMPTIPASVREQVVAPATRPASRSRFARWKPDRARIVRELLAAAQSGTGKGEPSWAVLGRLIEETTFNHAWRSMDFVGNMLSTDTSGVKAECMPLIADHPYRAYVASIGVSRRLDRDEVDRLLSELDIHDADYQMEPMIDDTVAIHDQGRPELRGKTFGVAARRLIPVHSDWTSEDLRRVVERVGMNNQAYVTMAERLLRIDPYSPVAVRWLIGSDWDHVHERFPQLESAYGRFPCVQTALYRHYEGSGDQAATEEALRRYLALSPDSWAYQTLADLQKKAGRTDDYVHTLQEMLKQDDFFLTHSRANSLLAGHFMEQGDCEKALPYAKAAASSGSGGGMLTLSSCYYGLRRWNEAEEWVRATAERYDTWGPEWYFWCKLTGFGDVKAARELAATFAGRMKASRRRTDMDTVAFFHLLDGNPTAAAEMLERIYNEVRDPYPGLFLMFIYDAQRQAAKRDALLEGIVTRDAQNPQVQRFCRPYLEIAEVLHRHMTGKGDLDLAAVEKTIKSKPEAEADITYVVGHYLIAREDRERGIAFLRRSVAIHDTGRPTWIRRTRLLAYDELRRLGAEPPSFERPTTQTAPASGPSVATSRGAA